MKLPIAVSLGMIAATLIAVSFQNQTISRLRGELKVVPTPRADPGDSTQRSHPAVEMPAIRAGRAAGDGAEALSADLIAKLALMRWEEGSDFSETEREALTLRILELDPTGLSVLVEQIAATENLSDERKGQALRFLLNLAGQTNPEAALNICLQPNDLLSPMEALLRIESSILENWALQDPLTTLTWLDINRANLHEYLLEQGRLQVIAGVLGKDPATAIAVARTMPAETLDDIGDLIARFEPDPTNILKFLAEIQSLSAEESDPRGPLAALRGATVFGLGVACTGQSFEGAMRLLDAAELNARDTQTIGYAIVGNSESLKNPGQWISWLNENTRPANREQNVKRLVETWTTRDFRATAEWIGRQPTGPLREQATRQFAETVAPHEPASAAEWALTLPESDQRTKLLKEIHHQWKQEDKEAAAAFADEQGIGE